jgi:hypothetical protein
MKRWGELNPIHFNEKKLEINLGEGKFIFVGSGTDMFAENVPTVWIKKVLDKCLEHPGNKYLFQTKNPVRFLTIDIDPKFILATTLETNRYYEEYMCKSPSPEERAASLDLVDNDVMITIEPIMDFDLDEFVSMIETCEPFQVNIGADSGGNGLPEPGPEKIEALIKGLSKFTKVKLKKNLKRLYKGEVSE